MKKTMITMIAITMMTLGIAQKNSGPNGKWVITSILIDGKLNEVSAKGYEVAFNNAESSVDTKICNNMGGKYKIDGNKIKFGAMRSTRMMCPEMNLETAIGKAFSDAEAFEFDQNKMMLKKGDQILMVLTMPV